MGEVRVPADRYWGAQTQRSLQNFDVGERMPLSIIRAFAILKSAAARANADFGILEHDKAAAIERVCREILSGDLDDHFPLHVWQTGSGTQTNMNVNEVIANRAHVLAGGRLTDKVKLLHPNDDVNKSQSSNDTFPSAMSIAAVTAVTSRLQPALEHLHGHLQAKSEAFADVVKIGRTHFMDATPISFGQEFSGYVAQLEAGMRALAAAVDPLSALAIGGTAVGTGLNAPKHFDVAVCRYVAADTGLNFHPADNKFAALASCDTFVEAHAAIKQIAVALTKTCNDLRFMSSGPRCGLAEISLPANEPGSSIMPGKVNPTQIEALTMVCAQVIANDHAIALGGMNGHFELNVYRPLVIYNFLQSVELLAGTCRNFADKCVAGLSVNEDKVKHYVDSSLMLVTALSKSIGYDNAAAIAKDAFARNITLRQAAIESLLVTAHDFDAIVVPENMI